jgi:LAO/AO transport system kinase
MQTSELASHIRKRDRRAMAKGISLVENDPAKADRLLRALRPPRHAFVIGVTGPPGTGKSSLVDRLIELYRKRGLRVGVIAVDPTSPITGGALLRDRIRMLSHSHDRGAFIRSMASSGWAGGLSRAASQAIQLLDSAGFDIIFLETVGIGQSDIEVARVAHSVSVVLMPGLGDEVQVSKAGLMEIGDVYVVNKSDLEGADMMMVSLLGMARGQKGRSPTVVKVSAMSGEGLDRLESSLESLRHRFESGTDVKLRSIKGMVVETARGDMMQRLGLISDSNAESLAKLVLAGKLTVSEAAAKLTRQD